VRPDDGDGRGPRARCAGRAGRRPRRRFSTVRARCCVSTRACGLREESQDGVHIEIEGPHELVTSFVEELRRHPPATTRIDELPRRYWRRGDPAASRLTTVISRGTRMRSSSRRTLPLATNAWRTYSIPPTGASSTPSPLARLAARDSRSPSTRLTIAPAPRWRHSPCAQVARRNMQTRATVDSMPKRSRAPSAALACRCSVEMGARWPASRCRRRAALLQGGQIVAVKGRLGGYHLACDAGNEAAVATLRGRKQRDDKPFAVMIPDVAAARRLCEISPEEATLLTSAHRPIVLLRRRPARAQRRLRAGAAEDQTPPQRSRVPQPGRHMPDARSASRALLDGQPEGRAATAALTRSPALVRIAGGLWRASPSSRCSTGWDTRRSR
jgi:hypothetical protein